MATIICATDFKPAAKNAAHYACKLAMNLKADVLLLHAQSVPGKLVKAVVGGNSDPSSALDELIGKLKAYYPAVSLAPKLITGNVADALSSYIKQSGEPLTVVIGNNYSKDNPTFMDGHIMQIFKNLRCPVVAVPAAYSYQIVKNICFAFDNHVPGAQDALLRLVKLTTENDLRLHILIGDADGFNRDNLPDVHPDANALLAPAKPIYHFIRKSDLNQNIVEFVTKNHIDVLAVMPRTHSGFGALLHKSHTQYLVNNCKLPVMALHEV
jgi:nucleotide-binding universal stress UspA family protein